MPYIEDSRRYDIVQNDSLLCVDELETAGELNYAITELCRRYVENNGQRYQQINDVLGALEGCKLEFYRRLVAPYEDSKIEQNGDVYD